MNVFPVIPIDVDKWTSIVYKQANRRAIQQLDLLNQPYGSHVLRILAFSQLIYLAL